MTDHTGAVQGTTEAGWESVRGAFEAVVAAERHHPEAQLAVFRDGRQVVDLWAGPATGPDTLGPVYSITKAAAHLVVALLVQEGVLELDREVSSYWPEFTGHGKERLVLRDLLAHKAGLVNVPEGFSLDELADDALLASRLAGAEPYWEPGTAYGYHAFVIGALTGEVVRRVTGKSVQEVFEERVRVPYGLDFHLGLKDADRERWAPVLPQLPTEEQLAALVGQPAPSELMTVAFNWHRQPPMDMVEYGNHPRVRALGPASAGGVATARGVARMYAAAISGVDGLAPLLKPETADAFARLYTAGTDRVTGGEDHFGIGFETQPQVGPRAFGHQGASGGNSWADPATGLAYAYTRRRFFFPGGMGTENEALTAAVLGVVA
ncbi:beta-lactamase family protein [Streptomyces bambusae]|uniref:serine hydrolase domain-containing protein n=1 Tax=Streptomyces bambusae TaxID=1550616 RepID=UPI001CFF733E|nr:serine hydrolase domain-containing protein [Streptomyces bambusae]MCB5169813.1 beta-lactamase family protein [Streptomyces bambusae]